MQNFRDTFQHIRTLPGAFWVVIGSTLMNQIGNMVIVFMVLYLNKSLNFSLTQASLAFATFSGTMFFSGLLGGGIIDKFGAPRMMIFSLMANSLSLFIFPFFNHLGAILLLCSLWGITFGIYRPASSTFISQLSSAGMHKITFSVYRLVLNLGMSIGPALGGYLANYSYSYIFYANGAANFIAAIILLTGLYSSPWFKQRPNQERQLEFNLSYFFQDRVLRLFMLGMIPVAMVFFQHESTLAVFINTDLHLPISFYGLLFTINTLIIVFLELALNIATINWPYRLNFMLGSACITIGFAGLYFASTQAHIILLTVFWTLGEMILFPSASSYIADIAPPAHRGSYMALYSSCSNIGMLLGPWGGALIMQHFGASILWLSCGFVGILALAAFYQLTEPQAELAT